MVPGWGLSKGRLSQGHVWGGIDATPRIPAVGVGVLVDTDASAYPRNPLILAVWECRILNKNATLSAQVFVAKPNGTGPGATPMQITWSRFPGFLFSLTDRTMSYTPMIRVIWGNDPFGRCHIPWFSGSFGVWCLWCSWSGFRPLTCLFLPFSIPASTPACGL